MECCSELILSCFTYFQFCIVWEIIKHIYFFIFVFNFNLKTKVSIMSVELDFLIVIITFKYVVLILLRFLASLYNILIFIKTTQK